MKHGLRSSYTHGKCRCNLCHEAARVYYRRLNERRVKGPQQNNVVVPYANGDRLLVVPTPMEVVVIEVPADFIEAWRNNGPTPAVPPAVPGAHAGSMAGGTGAVRADLGSTAPRSTDDADD